MGNLALNTFWRYSNNYEDDTDKGLEIVVLAGNVVDEKSIKFMNNEIVSVIGDLTEDEMSEILEYYRNNNLSNLATKLSITNLNSKYSRLLSLSKFVDLSGTYKERTLEFKFTLDLLGLKVISGFFRDSLKTAEVFCSKASSGRLICTVAGKLYRGNQSMARKTLDINIELRNFISEYDLNLKDLESIKCERSGDVYIKFKLD